MNMGHMRDSCAFHVLDRSSCSRFDLTSGGLCARTRRDSDKSGGPLGGKDLHRQLIKEQRWRRDDREPQGLHVKKPGWALSAKVTVNLNGRADNVSNLKSGRWVCTGDAADDNRVRFLLDNCQCRCVRRVHRAYPGLDNAKPSCSVAIIAKQRAFESRGDANQNVHSNEQILPAGHGSCVKKLRLRKMSAVKLALLPFILHDTTAACIMLLTWHEHRSSQAFSLHTCR